MKHKARLSPERFLDVVDATPLISIDLVIRDSQERVLLGYRNNRPAQNYWFVPGGRILKNELLDDAFERLLKIELGERFSPSLISEEAQFLGVYQHLYADNALGVDGVSTHYVVLGYELVLSAEYDLAIDLNAQHSMQKWWDVDELLASDEVHRNTKAYFDSIYC